MENRQFFIFRFLTLRIVVRALGDTDHSRALNKLTCQPGALMSAHRAAVRVSGEDGSVWMS